MSALEAARMGDEIGHTYAWLGFVTGVLAGIALACLICTGVGVVIAAVGFAALLGGAGLRLGKTYPTAPKGPIGHGSGDTLVGMDRRRAARAGVDWVKCTSDGKKLLAQGSSTVHVNNNMFARRTEKIVCDATIRDACPTVLIGGPTTTVPGLVIEEEVPSVLVDALNKAAFLTIFLAGSPLAVLAGLALFTYGGKVGEFVHEQALSHGLSEREAIVAETVAMLGLGKMAEGISEVGGEGTTSGEPSSGGEPGPAADVAGKGGDVAGADPSAAPDATGKAADTSANGDLGAAPDGATKGPGTSSGEPPSDATSKGPDGTGGSSQGAQGDAASKGSGGDGAIDHGATADASSKDPGGNSGDNPAADATTKGPDGTNGGDDGAAPDADERTSSNSEEAVAASNAASQGSDGASSGEGEAPPDPNGEMQSGDENEGPQETAGREAEDVVEGSDTQADAKDDAAGSEESAPPDPNGEDNAGANDEQGRRVYREDKVPYLSEGKNAGTLKSHIDSEGNIRPANPDGDATIQQHVRGSEPAKSDSPYTSFKDVDGAGKSYGTSKISVDMTHLQQDIASGKLEGVEVVEPAQVQEALGDAIDQAQARYDKNPTPKNADRLNKAQQDYKNSSRDHEVLIKGIIPSDYVTVEDMSPNE